MMLLGERNLADQAFTRHGVDELSLAALATTLERAAETVFQVRGGVAAYDEVARLAVAR